jgi:hypothetical protein
MHSPTIYIKPLKPKAYNSTSKYTNNEKDH